ncbi:MAG: DUF4330 family protein [Haloarculaceae archaeon]
MEIIDSEGRLFGSVNVIDALVLLFVLAALVAGVALVAGSGGQPKSSTSADVSSEYATLTIGPLSGDSATALAEADNLTIDGSETHLAVTDSVRTPHPTRDASFTVVRVRLPSDSGLATLNHSFDVTDGQLSYNASLSGLTNESTVDHQTRSIVLETTVPEQIAGTVESGDAYQVAGETVATVTGVQRLGIQGGQRQLRVALDVRTFRVDGNDQFARRTLRLGTSLPFRTESYSLTGTLVSRTQGNLSSENVTVQAEATVAESVAANVEDGDEYAIGQQRVAEIESVSSYPVADTTAQRLVMTLSLQAVTTDGRPQFLGTPVRVGSTIPFETSSYQLDATLVGLSDSRPGSPVDATLEVKWEDRRPELADAVSSGMTEQHRGADAMITDVTREPATEILRTDGGDIYARDHPVNEDVTLNVSVEARQTDGTLSFHGRPVQTGDNIVLDFGSVTVDGTVSGITVDD